MHRRNTRRQQVNFRNLAFRKSIHTSPFRSKNRCPCFLTCWRAESKVDQISVPYYYCLFLYRNAASTRSVRQRSSMTERLSWRDALGVRRLSLGTPPLTILTSSVRIPKRLHKLHTRILSESYFFRPKSLPTDEILVLKAWTSEIDSSAHSGPRTVLHPCS